MAQFDVYRNGNPESRRNIPFLLDVQSDLLEPLASRVVVPLYDPKALKNRLAARLNPIIEVAGRKLAMVTPELAGIPRKALGEPVQNVAHRRDAIIAALDLLLTGI